MDASVLRAVWLLGTCHDVSTKATAGHVGLWLIPVDGGATLGCTPICSGTNNGPTVVPHHCGDVHGSMKSVALSPCHDVAIFLLILSSSSSLICWHDDATEVADRISRGGELSHFDRASIISCKSLVYSS